MILPGQRSTEILRTKNSIVRLCEDNVTDSYSIGIKTPDGVQWKYISKDLHNLLVNELSQQKEIIKFRHVINYC